MTEQTQHERDFGFFIWMLPSVLFMFGFIAQFSIGLPFLLAGVVLFGYLHWRGPQWPADLGLLAGVGVGLLLFWLLPTDYSPAPFLVAGLGLIALSSFAFWYLRCRRSTATSTAT